MTRRDVLLVALLTVAALWLRLWHLDQPDALVFDEEHYVPAALDYLAGRPDSNPYHPPLGKLLIASGIRAGEKLGLPAAMGWRLGAAVVGTLMVPLCCWLAWEVSAGSRVATGAAGFLLATDFLHLVQSRIGMLDIYLAFFILLGLVFTWRCLDGGPGWLVLASAAFGLASACKWNGLLGAVAAAAVLLASSETTWRSRFRIAAVLALGQVLIYLLVMLPFHGLEPEAWSRTVQGHRDQIELRTDREQFEHLYASSPWTWPLALRPVWYLYEEDADRVIGIVGMGSPVFWWSVLLFWSEKPWRDRARRFLLIGYFCLWVPWFLSPTGGFLYYMLPSVPLMACLVGQKLEELWRARHGEALVGVYLATIALTLATYLPFLLGLPSTLQRFQQLFFLPQWI